MYHARRCGRADDAKPKLVMVKEVHIPTSNLPHEYPLAVCCDREDFPWGERPPHGHVGMIQGQGHHVRNTYTGKRENDGPETSLEPDHVRGGDGVDFASLVLAVLSGFWL
ncbi:hypothetical protein N7507_009530 [Penicillium longicatenatum]|nr:hypothetical protein N7507_009530 [Penicillium longicatenatum]